MPFRNMLDFVATCLVPKCCQSPKRRIVRRKLTRTFFRVFGKLQKADGVLHPKEKQEVSNRVVVFPLGIDVCKRLANIRIKRLGICFIHMNKESCEVLPNLKVELTACAVEEFLQVLDIAGFVK